MLIRSICACKNTWMSLLNHRKVQIWGKSNSPHMLKAESVRTGFWGPCPVTLQTSTKMETLQSLFSLSDHPHSPSEWGKQRGRVTSTKLLAALLPLQPQLGIAGVCLIWCPSAFQGPFLQSFFLDSWSVLLCLGLLLSRRGPCTADQNSWLQHQPLRYAASGQPLTGLHSANNSPLNMAI